MNHRTSCNSNFSLSLIHVSRLLFDACVNTLAKVESGIKERLKCTSELGLQPVIKKEMWEEAAADILANFPTAFDFSK